MKLVFDASSLLNVIRSTGSDAFKYLKGGYILTLTPYEIGNVLWKEATLIKRISIDEAFSILNLINKIYKFLIITSPHNNSLILKVAYELGITYYDSAYIVLSHELDAILVTDDEKLKKKINEREDILYKVLSKKITLYSTRELIKNHKI